MSSFFCDLLKIDVLRETPRFSPLVECCFFEVCYFTNFARISLNIMIRHSKYVGAFYGDIPSLPNHRLPPVKSCGRGDVCNEGKYSDHGLKDISWQPFVVRRVQRAHPPRRPGQAPTNTGAAAPLKLGYPQALLWVQNLER